MCDAMYRYLIVYTIENDNNNEQHNQFVQAIGEKYNINDGEIIDQSTIGLVGTSESPQDVARFLRETWARFGIDGTIRLFCTGHMANTKEYDEIFQYNVH